jgi:hypothetical protein
VDPAVIGVLIPVVAIIFGTGTAMLNVLLDYRKKRAIFELHHRERLAAIEKGLDVPPLPLELLQGHRGAPRSKGDHLRRGLIWTMVGAGVTAALLLEHLEGAYFGLIPAGIGVALLMYYFGYARREEPPAPPQP